MSCQSVLSGAGKLSLLRGLVLLLLKVINSLFSIS